MAAAAAVIDYLSDDATEEKLKDLFEFYDIDGNKKISRGELIDVLSLCAHEIGLEVDAYLEQIADALFSNAKLTPCGSITFEALKEVLKNRPTLVNELSLVQDSRNPLHDATGNQSSRLFGGPDEGCDLLNAILACWDYHAKCLSKHFPICNKLRWEYISNNLVRFNFFLVLMFISLCLILVRIISYWSKGLLVVLARCSGQCLNLYCSVIVLLVCRRSISQLRAYGYGRYLPLDDHIYFHKMLGFLILAHSISHTTGHFFNFLILSQMEPPEGQAPGPTWAQYLFSTHLGIGWIGGAACLTGWLLLLIILVMVVAHQFSRRLGKFELFYYTHLLYIPFWFILFIHAPRFWMWFLGPCLVFTAESILRLRNLLTNLTTDGRTTIINATPLPSEVIHLVIKRPSNFEYNPGDWIYVLIPEIAKYEWHPFTISSAPEQEGVIWLHIRAVGEWTKSLRAYFNGVKHRNQLSGFIKSGQFSISMDQFGVIPDTSMTANPTVWLDGPYGSPSSQIFRAEHAVLIATGIGVTPFASILQSIVHHYEKRRQKCPSCSHEFVDTRPPIVCKLKKVDFVWINRDQKSFEWFIKLLAELELTQSHLPQEERFLDIHIHLTAMEPAKIKSVGLQLALYLVHEKNKKDLVTGLRTRTKAGRPNWNEFFAKIEDQKKGKVSVFFCGRPQLGRLLHRQCDSFGFRFRKEIF